MSISLRTRMVLAALVPVVLVVLGLTLSFLSQHWRALDEALDQRGRALARQAAAAAEFSLFTGNREFMLSVAMGVLRTDGDVLGVAVVDGAGQIMAQAGAIRAPAWPALAPLESIAATAEGRVFAVPVEHRTLAVDDAYSGNEIAVAARPRGHLGHVVVEVSSERLRREQTRLVWLALLTAVIGAVVGGGLALRIARGVTEPLLEATDTVTRIGRGDLVARANVARAGVLRDLAEGINAMAHKVAMTQDELRARVEVATEELKRQRDTAERATAAKTRFLAAASHDLRQPLHAVGLFVGRLAAMHWPAEQSAVIKQIEDSVNALQSMLETLLDMSRLDVGGYRVESYDFAIGALLERLSQDLAPLAEEKGLRLRVRPGRHWAHADPRLVTRIVLNLLANALRYTAAGGVLVACRRRGEGLRIEVWDSGPGIARDLLGEIFDEYVQIGNPERDRAKGLGLGLAISQRAANLLGTRIEVRSEPGHGSVFGFDLPLGKPQVDEVATVAPREGGLSGTVLIVEDDAACRESTAALLRAWGANTLTAISAAEALALLRETKAPPEVAICDVHLPGGTDGIDLGRQLRQRYPQMRVLLISADQAPMAQARARAAGFPILKKPVAPSRLRAALLAQG